MKTHPSQNARRTVIEHPESVCPAASAYSPLGIRAAYLLGQHAQREQPQWLDSSSLG